MLSLLTNYLHGRYQRVILNGETSSWDLVKSRIPEGSVLGSLFLYFIEEKKSELNKIGGKISREKI